MALICSLIYKNVLPYCQEKYDRMDFDTTKWRIIRVNVGQKFCQTYPELLCSLPNVHFGVSPFGNNNITKYYLLNLFLKILIKKFGDLEIQ